MRKYSDDQISQIKKLRSLGFSTPEISNTLGISRTTVLRYIKGVQILPEYLPEWSLKRGGSRKRMLLREQKALEEMNQLIDSLSIKEKLLVLSSLYWGEGEKRDFGLSNTDPNLVRVFMWCMREVFGVDEDRFKISIRVYEDLDKEECLKFWSQVTNIPVSEFLATDVLLGKKLGKLTYGMCRIRIKKGGDLLKKVKAVNSIITKLCVPVAQLDRAPRS